MKKRNLLLIVLALVFIVSGCQVKDVKIPEPEIDSSGAEIEVEVDEKEEITTPEEVKVIDKGEKKAKLDKNIILSMYGEDKNIIDYIDDFVGYLAPDLEIEDMDGNRTTIYELAQQTGIIIEFMGVWCPVCEKAVPEIEKFKEENPDAKIISIALNSGKEELSEFVEKTGSTTKYYAAVDEEAIKRYSLMFVPAFFFIDKEMYVQMILAGNMPSEILYDFYQMIY